VSKIAAGIGLWILAIFMSMGFARANIQASRPAIVLSFLIAVVLPAAGGLGLIYSHTQGDRRLVARRQQLQQQTLESEILRLATAAQGKITQLEVMRDLAIDQPLAQQTLDTMLSKGILDLEITDSGVLVYTIYDLQNLAEKSTSKRISDV
jgi:predicted DNA-binding transcriptional regulator